MRITYDAGQRRFACRQITRLDPATGHQTQILTTRADPDPAAARARHVPPLEPGELLPLHARPLRPRRPRQLRHHRRRPDPHDTQPGPAPRRPGACATPAAGSPTAKPPKARPRVGGRRPSHEILDAFADARAEVERLAAAAKAIPAKLPLGEVRPDAVRLAPERKRIHDAIRMATYNAESALARMLAPHYARADDEARSLLREAFRAPADLEIVGDQLHVRLSPLSAPRRTRAIAALCDELTATKTLYPGTKLTLVYSVKTDR